MSSVICSTPMCTDGRSAVAKMVSTHEYLTTEYPTFNSGGYLPAVNAIQADLEAVDSWYAGLIPFNPVCCTIDEIGLEADALTNQMINSVGAVGVPIPPPATDWGTVIVVGGVLVLLVVYSPQIKSIFKK